MKPEENLAMSVVFTLIAGTVILCAGLPVIAFLVVAAVIEAIMGALVVKDI